MCIRTYVLCTNMCVYGYKYLSSTRMRIMILGEKCVYAYVRKGKIAIVSIVYMHIYIRVCMYAYMYMSSNNMCTTVLGLKNVCTCPRESIKEYTF